MPNQQDEKIKFQKWCLNNCTDKMKQNTQILPYTTVKKIRLVTDLNAKAKPIQFLEVSMGK